MTTTEEEKMDFLWELWPPKLVKKRQVGDNKGKRVRPPDDLLCPICLELLFDPLVTDKCGHLFCRQCLDDWMEGNKQCPIDRIPLSSAADVRDDMRAWKQIGNLYCKCKDVECQWEGRINALADHCKECGYKPKNNKERKRLEKRESDVQEVPQSEESESESQQQQSRPERGRWGIPLSPGLISWFALGVIAVVFIYKVREVPLLL